jgi:hypothetical protein
MFPCGNMANGVASGPSSVGQTNQRADIGPNKDSMRRPSGLSPLVGILAKT